MHIASSVTSLSWIPQGAVEGFNRLSFGLHVAHYDPPPPEELGDLDQLQATDRFRFVNRLEAWIEVQDGRIVDTGQSGGGPHQRDEGGLRRGQRRLCPDGPARGAARPGDRPYVGTVRADCRRSGRLSRPSPGPPRALRPDRRTSDLDHPRPDHPRRRHRRAAPGRGQLLPPPLGL
jgi:hypothetical protein